MTINNRLLVMSSDEVYEMAKATANANEQGRDHKSVIVDLADRIFTSSVDVDLFKDPQIQERLGADFEKVMTHVQRMREFSRTFINSYKMS